MLNYIRAELYKVRHRTYAYVLLALLLAGEALFAFSWLSGNAKRSYADLVGLLSTTMLVGAYLTVALSDVVFSEQFKHNTLKNEISFGLSRTRIYLGKLCTAALVSFAVLAVVLGFFLGLGWLFTPHDNPEAERAALAALAYTVAASIPLWLGALGMVQLLFVLLKNELAAAVIFTCFLSIGPMLFQFIHFLRIDPVSHIAGLLYQVMPLVVFLDYIGAMGAGLMLRTWLTGLGWLALTTTAGLVLFHRREL